MKEIDKNYFSLVSKIVNEKSYNNDIACNYVPIHFYPLSSSHYSSIKSSLLHNGFSIIQIMNLVCLDQEKIGELLQNILGEPFINKNPGKKIYAKIQSEENAKFYVNSNLAQPIHTDEGYTNIYPRYVALYCSLEAKIGGESIIVPFKSLYTELINQFGDDVNLLFQQDAVTIKHAHGIEKKPILLRLDDNEVGISYSPILQKMWCSERVFTLFNYITRYAHNCSNQIRFKLKAGQVLLFDNCKVLHGRTVFSKNEQRLLYRYWYKSCTL